MKKEINQLKAELKKEILNARRMRDMCDKKNKDESSTMYWAGNLSAFKISLKKAQNIISK